MIAIKTDVGLQREALRELGWDTRVPAAEIGVSVHEGVVTLTGFVDSLGEKLAAQDAAHRVAGVLDVANDIEVRVPHTRLRSDAEIAAAVRHTLEWNVFIPHERIRSTVTNGWVTLEGMVDSARQRRDAGEAILLLDGVMGVSNDITVLGPPVNAAQVHEAIEEALARRAEREAHHVGVRIHDGTVTLTGTVQSWPEKRAVIGVAEHAPGVQAIDDQLTVKPYT